VPRASTRQEGRTPLSPYEGSASRSRKNLRPEGASSPGECRRAVGGRTGAHGLAALASRDDAEGHGTAGDVHDPGDGRHSQHRQEDRAFSIGCVIVPWGSALRREMPLISEAVLIRQLRELAAVSLIERIDHGEVLPRVDCRLTKERLTTLQVIGRHRRVGPGADRRGNDVSLTPHSQVIAPFFHS